MSRAKTKKTPTFDRLSWQEFEKIIKAMIREIRKRRLNYDAILAISRGGLIPGVILSHQLGISNFQITSISRNISDNPYSKKKLPIIKNTNYRAIKRAQRLLIVDDISGTGVTLLELIKKLKIEGISKFDIFVVVKFMGSYCPPSTLPLKFFGKICRNWVIFPWEKQI